MEGRKLQVGLEDWKKCGWDRYSRQGNSIFKIQLGSRNRFK